MTLEEKIRQMLVEAASQEASAVEATEAAAEESIPEAAEAEAAPVVSEETVAEAKCDKKEMTKESDCEEPSDDVIVDKKPSLKKDKAAMKMESNVTSQVAALLTAEGLSEEFKLQAVTIFEAAVADKVIAIEERLEEEYQAKLEQAQSDLVEHIDGFMSHVAQEWVNENRLAIEKSFRLEMAESLIDGMRSLFVEHYVDIPAESESALEIAISEVEALEAKLEEQKQQEAALIEQINTMKQESILESYRSDMTATEYDRFTQLVEHIGYASEEQYKKQLDIVRRNFAVIAEKKEVVESIVESKQTLAESAPVFSEEKPVSKVNAYADFIKNLSSK